MTMTLSNGKTITKRKYVGTVYHPKQKKWMSLFRQNGMRTYLGSYRRAIDAAWIHDQYAFGLLGEEARTNGLQKTRKPKNLK